MTINYFTGDVMEQIAGIDDGTIDLVATSHLNLVALRMPKNMPVTARWWEKVQTAGTDECWVWAASRDKNGYGKFQYPREGRQVHVRAHRYGYELLVGEIPAGHHVLHRCDNPPCVNPAHLFLGTNDENVADRVKKGRNGDGGSYWSDRTECGNGHPLTEPNVSYVTKQGRNPYRRCKTCASDQARIAYRKKHGLEGSGTPRKTNGR